MLFNQSALATSHSASSGSRILFCTASKKGKEQMQEQSNYFSLCSIKATTTTTSTEYSKINPGENARAKKIKAAEDGCTDKQTGGNWRFG